jgi:hypothetical protein
MVTSQESMTKESNRRFMINIIRTRTKKQDRAVGALSCDGMLENRPNSGTLLNYNFSGSQRFF